jgi:hypothetical protein
VLDSPLDEVVVFEVSGFEDATQLCRCLGADWFAWVQSADGYRSVAVLLDPRARDLGSLLQAAQQWFVQRGCDAICFELDGRHYAIETALKAAA